MPTDSKIAESQVLGQQGEDTSPRRDTLDVDVQTQLLMLKKNEYYFNSNNEPQSQFMQSDSPSTFFVKSKNPFEERQQSVTYDREVTTVEELEKMMEGTRPQAQSSISKPDPISMAQSMKNPYVNDEQKPSRDTFNMNDPKSSRESNQFQTFRQGNLQINPYLNDQHAPVDLNEEPDLSPTTKLRQIISEQTMSNMKRPGKRQKEGISSRPLRR